MSTTKTFGADHDAATYATYVEQGENKAATARELGISPKTVAERVKRHLARAAQDEAGEATDEAPAATTAPAGYNGNVCPQAPIGCGKIAKAFKGGHDSTCNYRKGGPGQLPVTPVGDNVVVLRPDAVGDYLDAAAAVLANRAGDEADEIAARHQVDESPAGEAQADAPAVDEPEAPADQPEADKADAATEPAVKATECVKCGYRFPVARVRNTCRSQAACDKRAAKRDAEAVAA